MNDIIKYIAGFITAVIGAWGTVWLQRAKNQGNNEGIYASHLDETLDRLTKTTQERDKFNRRVMNLQLQVKEQSKLIKQQSELIESLKKQVDQLNKKINEIGVKDGND